MRQGSRHEVLPGVVWAAEAKAWAVDIHPGPEGPGFPASLQRSSCFHEHCNTERSPASSYTPSTGIGPKARTASPAALMFIAALTSRS